LDFWGVPCGAAGLDDREELCFVIFKVLVIVLATLDQPQCVRWRWTGDVFERKVYCVEWRNPPKKEPEKKKGNAQ
jgi:hypothetical protein